MEKERKLIVSHEEAKEIMESFPYRLIVSRNPYTVYCAMSPSKVWGTEIVITQKGDDVFEIKPARE